MSIRYGESPGPIEEYARHFERCGDARHVLEATPGYFYGGRPVAEAMRATLPGVKIVILLRNPVERLMSFFRFKQGMLELDPSMSFEEYVHACRDLPWEDANRQENNRLGG